MRIDLWVYEMRTRKEQSHSINAAEGANFSGISGWGPQTTNRKGARSIPRPKLKVVVFPHKDSQTHVPPEVQCHRIRLQSVMQLIIHGNCARETAKASDFFNFRGIGIRSLARFPADIDLEFFMHEST